jgi:hypothetical protein
LRTIAVGHVNDDALLPHRQTVFFDGDRQRQFCTERTVGTGVQEKPPGDLLFVGRKWLMLWFGLE